MMLDTRLRANYTCVTRCKTTGEGSGGMGWGGVGETEMGIQAGLVVSRKMKTQVV